LSRSSSSRSLSAVAMAVLIGSFFSPPDLRAAASAGAVRGRVTGPDGAALAGIPVALRNDVTGFRAETSTAADGTFRFFNVPYNPYEVHVEVQGFRPTHRSVDVRSVVAPELAIVLELAGLQESVTVEQALRRLGVERASR